MSAFKVQSKGKSIAAWCLYDWGNSAFTTLVVTFLYATFFAENFAEDSGRGTALWSRGITLSALAVAGLAPIAGRLADCGDRRRHLIACVLICVGFTTALTFVQPGQPHAVITALGLFVVANVAFELSLVFYNAFLPSLAAPGQIGKISGYGWGLGYVGGLCTLGIALLGFVSETPWFGMATENGFNIRATNLLVAGWFLIFSIPMFIYLRDDDASRAPVQLRSVFGDLLQTFRSLRKYREISVFLIARLLYNDGLVTIFAFGGIYAAGTFGFTFQELAMFGIVINVGAGMGALLFGFVDDRIGGKKTIAVSLVALSAATILGALAPNRTWFWVAAVLVGVFAGPNQSASRSLMARLVPSQHAGEFFGFFAFSGKVTAFLGPLLLGLVADAYGQRTGMASLLVFFIFGGLILWRVDEKRGAISSSIA